MLWLSKKEDLEQQERWQQSAVRYQFNAKQINQQYVISST